MAAFGFEVVREFPNTVAGHLLGVATVEVIAPETLVAQAGAVALAYAGEYLDRAWSQCSAPVYSGRATEDIMSEIPVEAAHRVCEGRLWVEREGVRVRAHVPNFDVLIRETLSAKRAREEETLRVERAKLDVLK